MMNKIKILVFIHLLMVYPLYGQDKTIGIPIESINLLFNEEDSTKLFRFSDKLFEVYTKKENQYTIYKSDRSSKHSFFEGYVFEFDSSILFFETDYSLVSTKRVLRFNSENKIDWIMYYKNGNLTAISIFKEDDGNLLEEFVYIENRISPILKQDLLTFKSGHYAHKIFNHEKTTLSNRYFTKTHKLTDFYFIIWNWY